MTVEELNEEKAKKALKAAVGVIHRELSCEYCVNDNDCIGESTLVRDERCENYILSKLLTDPTDINTHILYSNF